MYISIVQILFLLQVISSFEFKLDPHQTFCFSDEFAEMQFFSGEASTLQKEMLIAIRIIDPKQKVTPRPAGSNLKYSYTTEISGVHQVCVDNIQNNLVVVQFSFNSGIMAKDYSNLAHKSDIAPIESQVSRIQEIFKQVHDQTQYQRESEEEMRNSFQGISGKVIGYSVSTVVVLFIVSTVQILYLKSWFRNKKII